MGLNSLLSVSNGSKYPGFLVEINLLGNKNKEKLALIGKGITFDSGGLSIKVGNHMVGMKTDMLGSATVLGIMLYLAKLKINQMYQVIYLYPKICQIMKYKTRRYSKILFWKNY